LLSSIILNFRYIVYEYAYEFIDKYKKK